MFYLLQVWQVSIPIRCCFTKISLVSFYIGWKEMGRIVTSLHPISASLAVSYMLEQCECPVETVSGSPKSFFSQPVCSAERGGWHWCSAIRMGLTMEDSGWYIRLLVVQEKLSYWFKNDGWFGKEQVQDILNPETRRQQTERLILGEKNHFLPSGNGISPLNPFV